MENRPMNIQPSAAAASIAGTDRAATRGGEADAKRGEASRQQSAAEAPGGKAADSSALDSGQETADRGGDGRQVLDIFEQSAKDEEEQAADQESSKSSANQESQGNHLDLEA
tara:strand:- start:16568 stop:16903 length:336 start_codon:yes stop_codon:yes gene_type:complete